VPLNPVQVPALEQLGGGAVDRLAFLAAPVFVPGVPKLTNQVLSGFKGV
jgi:hypothetical protein